MLALLAGLALSVCRVEPPPLVADLDHFLLVFDLINVFIARGSNGPNAVLLNVKDKVVLPHKGTAH